MNEKLYFPPTHFQDDKIIIQIKGHCIHIDGPKQVISDLSRYWYCNLIIQNELCQIWPNSYNHMSNKNVVTSPTQISVFIIFHSHSVSEPYIQLIELTVTILWIEQHSILYQIHTLSQEDFEVNRWSPCYTYVYRLWCLLKAYCIPKRDQERVKNLWAISFGDAVFLLRTKVFI